MFISQFVFIIAHALSVFFAQDGDLIEDRLLKRDFAEATGFDKVRTFSNISLSDSLGFENIVIYSFLPFPFFGFGFDLSFCPLPPPPTLQEVDMSMLPKVLQVKDFGFAGRTKYTHLVDQDTSNLQSNPWAAAEKELGVKRHAFRKQ